MVFIKKKENHHAYFCFMNTKFPDRKWRWKSDTEHLLWYKYKNLPIIWEKKLKTKDAILKTEIHKMLFVNRQFPAPSSVAGKSTFTEFSVE